jgi:hypothetical protein
MGSDSSLELLVEINRSERIAQLSHFDSLDTKAGLVLGFAGVLIAVARDTDSWAGITSIVFAGLAAAAAVAAFWPRQFPSIDPIRLGDYAASELVFTQLTVLDTMEIMITNTNSVLSVKARRLKTALACLLIGAVLGAVSLIDG